MRLQTLAPILILLFTACDHSAKPELAIPEQLPASRPAITVSGLSSGGYMAAQMHVALSGQIVGIGIIAAGPYNCSQGSLQRALGVCTRGGELDTSALVESTRQAAQAERIDPVVNLRSARIWLFHGAQDTTVARSVVVAAREFYSELGSNADQLRLVTDVPAAHGFPIASEGVDCGVLAPPFLNACDYDAAGEMLSYLTNTEITAADMPRGNVREIPQPKAGGLGPIAYVYEPPQCDPEASCDLHIAFHGCGQSSERIGERFVRNAGYNRWADALNLVVIYPQVAANALVNPLGCWDWWGYTNSDFATRRGVQVTAIEQLVEQYIRGEI